MRSRKRAASKGGYSSPSRINTNLSGEPVSEFKRFRDVAERLVRVPKTEITKDEKPPRSERRK